LRYICMCFGWYQELLRDMHVDNLVAAEARIFEMLDQGGMIVHAYRETDLENPELVGRHGRLRSFMAANDFGGSRKGGILPHEIERFLLDTANLDAWTHASKTGGLLEGRWSVVDLWSTQGQDQSCLYGKAILVARAAVGASPMVFRTHCAGLQH
jgi:hypothetical protein